MSKTPDLDLITLTVTPHEARMLATASMARSIHYQFAADPPMWDKDATIGQSALGEAYQKLCMKVDRQRRL